MKSIFLYFKSFCNRPTCTSNFNLFFANYFSFTNSIHRYNMELSNQGSSHKGQKLRSYSFQYKLQVVEFAKGNSNHKAAKMFGVDRKRIIEWKKTEGKIREQLENGELKKSMKRHRGGGRRVRYSDIDQTVITWMEECRDKGVRVTGKGLKQECLRLHKLNGNQSFKASCGWLRSFMKRHNISFRRATHIAQKLPSELDEKRQNFLAYIIRMRRMRQYDLSHIGNMDETPIWVDMPGNSTLHQAGAKTVSMKTTGNEKTRITVMLAAMADGTKLNPLVLFKGVRPPKEIPNGIQVKMMPKSWANVEVMQYWLRNVWRRQNQRRLLVWDSFSAHITPVVKQNVRVDYNSDMAVIPGGCTSKLQPCDVSWNKPLKDLFRDMYDQWVLEGQVELTRGGNRKQPDRIQILKWIKEAWSSITPELIRKSFRVTGISLEMDGSQDDLLFAENDEDPFEGFTAAEVAEAEEFHANTASTVPAMQLDSLNEYSDEESESEDDVDDYECPDSPGH